MPEYIKMINKLYKIANYYKRKYHLHTMIDIVNDLAWCNYKPAIDSLIISLQDIKNKYQKGIFQDRNNIKDMKKLYIWCLLHELKHAIDFYLDDQSFKINVLNDRSKLHDKRYLELQADKFANKEYKKWKI